MIGLGLNRLGMGKGEVGFENIFVFGYTVDGELGNREGLVGLVRVLEVEGR